MAAQIGHINPLIGQQIPTTVDAAEAARSGGLRNLLGKVIEARAGKPRVAVKTPQQESPKAPPPVASMPPEGQVSAKEQAQAVALRGRELDDKKLSGKFRDMFLAFTTGDSKFLELCINSLISSIDQGSSSVIDDLKTSSPEEKLAIKLLLLQIAILDADQYGLGGEQLERLVFMRDRLLANYNQSLDEFLMSAAVAIMASKPLRIGIKQLASANRILAGNESLDSLEIHALLSKLLSSNPKRLLARLKALREHWLLLTDREKTQYPLKLTAQRQHFIQSRINQINVLIDDLRRLDQISKVCEKAGVRKVPESARVLIELIGIVASQGVGSVNRLTRMFDGMSPARRGTQIYCVNLRHVVNSGLIYSGRQNEKTFYQVVQTIVNTLKSSYMHKPVEAEGT